MSFPFAVTTAEMIETVVLCSLRGKGLVSGAFGSIEQVGNEYLVTVEGKTYSVVCGARGWTVSLGAMAATDDSLLEAATTLLGARKFFS